MYEIIVTKDFIDVIKKLPLEHANILTHSFLSIKEIPDNRKIENTFIKDLLDSLQK